MSREVHLSACDLDEYLEFAFRLAESAGNAILPHFRRAIEVDNKAAQAFIHPVMIAVRAAEHAMRQEIDEIEASARLVRHGGECYNSCLLAGLFAILSPQARLR